MTIVLALLAAAGYGTADFFGGFATKRAPTLVVTVLAQCVGILTVFAVAWALPVAHPRAVDLEWGALAGLVGGSGLALFYRALGRGVMSVIAPVTGLACIAVPVLFGLAAGERPGRVPLLGVGLALVAVVLVSVTVAPAPSSDATRRSLRATVPAPVLAAAIASGVCFGSFYVIIRHASPAAGIWPLAAGRSASVLLYVMGSLVTRRPLPLRAPRSAWGLIVAAGAIDMSANICYLQATHRGLLTIVGTLASMYPVMTLLLARWVLHERVSRVQGLGLFCAVGAVVLICGP